MPRLVSPGCSIWGPTLAENPLVTLARLLGGVVLMQGRLGHQVLGQMLVMNSHEIAVVGASVVLAASSETKSAAGQVALRTAAPAIAAHILITRDEQRLVKARELLEKRQRAIAAAPPPPDPRLERAEERIAALEEERRWLTAELSALSLPAPAPEDPVAEPAPESPVEIAPDPEPLPPALPQPPAKASRKRRRRAGKRGMPGPE